jgi:hypothetical protein
LHNVEKGFVAIGPAGHRLGITRQGPQTAEGRTTPIGGPQQNWHDAGRTGLVALHGMVDFDVPTVVGGEEVGTDQQQNYIGLIELSIDFTVPFGAGQNLPIVPLLNYLLALQVAEMGR